MHLKPKLVWTTSAWGVKPPRQDSWSALDCDLSGWGRVEELLSTDPVIAWSVVTITLTESVSLWLPVSACVSVRVNRVSSASLRPTPRASCKFELWWNSGLRFRKVSVMTKSIILAKSWDFCVISAVHLRVCFSLSPVLTRSASDLQDSVLLTSILGKQKKGSTFLSKCCQTLQLYYITDDWLRQKSNHMQ